MSILSVRLDDELEEKLQYIMKKRKIVDKSEYIRQLINKSLTEDLIDYLCNEVKIKNYSAWKAAEIAGISLRAMLAELANRDIPSYGENTLKEDLDFATREGL